MYILLILFFTSLFAIIIMIANKLSLVRNGHSARVHHYSHLFALDLDKVKASSVKNMKKFGYITVFVMLRLFIKSTHFLKTKTLSFINYMQEKMRKGHGS